MITPAALAGWLDIPTTPALTEEKTAALQIAIDAAVGLISARCTLPEDGPGLQTIAMAETLIAARLYKRKGSPEGVAGWGDLGVVRVTSFDPDVERLLAPFLKFTFA